MQDNHFFRSFASFTPDFEHTLTMVENDSKVMKSDLARRIKNMKVSKVTLSIFQVAENRRKTEMRSFEDSAKSKKTIASMIENNNSSGAKTGPKVGQIV